MKLAPKIVIAVTLFSTSPAASGIDFHPTANLDAANRMLRDLNRHNAENVNNPKVQQRSYRQQPAREQRNWYYVPPGGFGSAPAPQNPQPPPPTQQQPTNAWFGPCNCLCGNAANANPYYGGSQALNNQNNDVLMQQSMSHAYAASAPCQSGGSVFNQGKWLWKGQCDCFCWQPGSMPAPAPAPVPTPPPATPPPQVTYFYPNNPTPEVAVPPIPWSPPEPLDPPLPDRPYRPESSATMGEQCSPAWEQCGGDGYTGPTCCEPGYVCKRQNIWYSQCKEAPPDERCPNKLWAKCAGVGYSGASCCPAGASCVMDNLWHWQCRPALKNPTVLTSTTSSTTTTDGCPNMLLSQCGGIDYHGPICCPTGTYCVKANPHYWQCRSSSSITSKVPTTTRRVTTTAPPKEFNYAEVLGKSLTFYYGQMSGKISGTFNTLQWRGDSALNDGSDNGVDLTGGFYDAGDHVKFGLPMSYSIYMLALSGINYENTYRATGQEWQRLLNIVKWGTHYFIKCHSSKYEFYGQVGQPNLEHSYWGPPETMTMSRPSFKINQTNPGSELAGSVAASFALASILFRKVDPSYSETLLQHGREMFEFATEYEGKYDTAIPEVRFYKSYSGYKDEQLLAALALYWATKELKYRSYAFTNSRSLVGSSLYYAPDWDNASYINLYLLWKLLGDTDAKRVFEEWVHYFMYDVKKTPQGMVYLSEWGSSRFTLASSFLMLCYVDCNPNLPPSKAEAYQSFAKSQIDYLLGNNNAGRSYLVGFGSNYPQHTHHRAAHGSTTNDVNNPSVNKNVNYMLVGGPDDQDNYADDVNNYKQSIGSTSHQAGLVGLAVALVKRFGGEPLFNFPECQTFDDVVHCIIKKQGTDSGRS